MIHRLSEEEQKRIAENMRKEITPVVQGNPAPLVIHGNKGEVGGYNHYNLSHILREFNENGYRIAAGEDLTEIMIQNNMYIGDSLDNGTFLMDGYSMGSGTFVRDAVVYHVPEKTVYLTKISPILDNINSNEMVPVLHAQGIHSYQPKGDLGKYLDCAVKVSPEKHAREVPTNRLGEDLLTCALFGENASKLGEMLQEAGVSSVHTGLNSLVGYTGETFVTQVNLRNNRRDHKWYIGGHLSCNIFDIRFHSRAFGVPDPWKKLLEERNAARRELLHKSKIYQTYYAEILKGVRSGELPASKLQEVLEVIERKITA